MRVRVLGAPLVGTVVVLASAPGAAALEVDAPRPVVQSADGGSAHWRSALDPSGDVVFARELNGAIGLGVGTPGAAVEPPEAPGGDDFIQLVTAPSGESLAVWVEDDSFGQTVRYATRAPGDRAFSSPRALEVPGRVLTNVDAAIAPNGAAAILVGDADAVNPTRLRVYRRAAGGELGPAEPLDGVGGEEVPARVVVDSNAAAAVVALAEPLDESAPRPLQVASARGGGEFDRLRPISGRNIDVAAFRVSTNGNGHVAVAWAGLRDINHAVIGATEGDLTALRPGREAPADGASNSVAVTLGGRGGDQAAVAWRTRRGVRVAPVDGSRIGRSTRYGRTPALGNAKAPGARFPAVALDMRGRRTVIWQEGWRRTRRLYARTSGVPQTQNLGFVDIESEVRLVASREAAYVAVSQLGVVQLRQSVAGGRFGRPQTVTALSGPGAVFDTRLHAHPNGRIAVVFGTSVFSTREQRLLAAPITP